MADPTQRITLAQVEAYAAYRGDADLWVRTHREQAKAEGTAYWHEIDALLTDLRCVEAGLASPRLAARVNARMTQVCHGDAVVHALRALAREPAPPA